MSSNTEKSIFDEFAEWWDDSSPVASVPAPTKPEVKADDDSEAKQVKLKKGNRRLVTFFTEEDEEKPKKKDKEEKKDEE